MADTDNASVGAMAARLNVNLLCIAGACIGIAAMTFTWVYYPPTMPSPPSPYMTPTILFMVSHHAIAFIAALLFVVGTASAFASPLGGFVQVSSLTIFAKDIIESANDPWLDGIDPQHQLQIGAWLGILSTTMVLTSLACPIGLGKMRADSWSELRLGQRILTVSRTRDG